jgi:hypothetical protein
MRDTTYWLNQRILGWLIKYSHPEDGKYNVCRNNGQLSTFDAAHARKPKFHTGLCVRSKQVGVTSVSATSGRHWLDLLAKQQLFSRTLCVCINRTGMLSAPAYAWRLLRHRLKSSSLPNVNKVRTVTNTVKDLHTRSRREETTANFINNTSR